MGARPDPQESAKARSRGRGARRPLIAPAFPQLPPEMAVFGESADGHVVHGRLAQLWISVESGKALQFSATQFPLLE